MTGVEELGRRLNGDVRGVAILVGGCITPATAVGREELEIVTGD